MEARTTVLAKRIERRIFLLRGQKVMLSPDLAQLYDVEPRAHFHGAGVAMLSSVLRRQRAVRVNIEIMRAFVRLRQMLASHADLARKVAALEKKYDAQFKVVFDAIRELMTPPEPKQIRIGFRHD